MSPLDLDTTLAEATRLRRFAFNPIPSHHHVGFPLFSYSVARERGLSASEFESEARRTKSKNIQVACGSHWDLAVIDVDGPLGMEVWDSWSRARNIPTTPTIETPRMGRQYWFSLPGSLSSVPTRRLWSSSEGTHEGIELLGDGRLARCPPSAKLVDGQWIPYRWVSGLELGSLPMARLPMWLVPPIHPKSQVVHVDHLKPKITKDNLFGSKRTDWRDVRDKIPDKVELARSWGLRVVSSKANQAGWLQCRSITRADHHPSAMFSDVTGRYWEPEMGRRPISIFDLGILLGVYADFPTAVKHLSAVYS